MEKLNLNVLDAFFLQDPPPGIEQGPVPGNAKKFSFEFGRILDLDRIAGKTGKCMDECLLFIRFTANEDGTSGFGIGADWWCEVRMQGKVCFSSMETGNVVIGCSARNHLFTLPVRKGENRMTIRVRRGSAGWKVACGPQPVRRYAGKIPWEAGPAPRPAPRTGARYQLIVLGDLHYDAEESIYHSDYCEPDARLNRIQREEFARNAAMWKDRNRRMMKSAASRITPETLAVIQLGDLIQGDCGNPEVHSRMLRDTFSFLKKEFKGLPFLTVTGNHDIRGTGADQAYRKTMPELLSQELQKKITGTTFYTMLGGDLYLFIDFNDPDFDVIAEAMTRKARFRFVISHGPVLPSDGGSFRWFLFGQDDSQRQAFHQLFMRNDVIVLTGHVHDIELTECVTAEGRITQLMGSSVWSDEKLQKLKTVFSDPAEYGKKQTDPDGKKLFQEYRNVITRYWKAAGAGYFVLDVSPSGVTADYFGGDSVQAEKTLRLR